jgi:hypothetical protein
MKDKLITLAIVLGVALVAFALYYIFRSEKQVLNEPKNIKPIYTIHAQKIFDEEIKSFSSTKYIPNEYNRIVDFIGTNKNDNFISSEEANSLKADLNNAYIKVLYDTITGFIKVSPTVNRLNELENQIQNLSELTEVNKSLKNDALENAREFRSTLNMLNNLEVLFSKSQYDEQVANNKINILNNIFKNNILNENLPLVKKVRNALKDFEDYKQVNTIYQSLENSKGRVPDRSNESLSRNGESSRIFDWYLKEFQKLKDRK